MEHNSPVEARPLGISPVMWILGTGLIVALVAIFIFNVAVSTVVYYSFIALMMGSHFFMHGSHGNYQHSSTSNTANSKANEHSGPAGGCH